MSLLFQCTHEYSKADATLHGFSHYTDRMPTQLRQYMQTFFEKQSHCKWIEFISAAFLHRKGLTLDAYLANIVSPDVPIDKLGLMIIARMYHSHIAVITSTYTWMSGWNLLAKECEFIFTYAGGLNFHMVCNKVEGFH